MFYIGVLDSVFIPHILDIICHFFHLCSFNVSFILFFALYSRNNYFCLSIVTRSSMN